MKRHPAAWTSALAVAMALLPTHAAAQALLVRVSDGANAEPLQGALVALTDGAGAPVRSALTDARGRYLFPGLVPGTYTVRAELIGYATLAETVAVSAGETTPVELRLQSRAIELEGISVSGESRCTLRPESGMQVADVWDEVRKALEAARFTNETGVYEYRTRSWSRNVDDDTGLVSDQQSRRGRLYLRSPYQSRPAADLLENGFVQDPTDGSDGQLYFAPDAAVLLSDEFLDTHCMRLKAGEDEEAGLVGLAFEPVSGRRIPDIAGTLWVDPESWELSRLEYTYENTRVDVETHGIGGEVDFQLLPNGTWIVPEWIIRMPLLALGRDGRGEETIYQFGFHEVGATVLTIREPGADVIFSASTAALEGVVVEEATREPLPGSEVYLVGTEVRDVADADGHFRLTEVEPGPYEVAFRRPSPRGFGPPSTPVGVNLRPGDVSSVTLRWASPFTSHEAACLEEFGSREDGTALLLGRVFEGGSELGLEGARVDVEWDEYGRTGVGNQVARMAAVATTGPDGMYRVCSVPDNTRLHVQARWGPLRSPQDTVRVPEGAPGRNHDIALGAGSSGSATALAGLVVGARGGEPVVGAEVRLQRVGGAAEARVRVSDQGGRFAQSEVDVGRHVVTVSALGYATVTDTLEAVRDRLNYVTIRLPEEALEIEGLDVEVEPRMHQLDMTGYYERRAEGLGVHIDGDAIEAQSPTTLPRVLGNQAGIRIGTLVGQFGSQEVVVVGGCLPTLYLDGTLVREEAPFVRNPSPSRGASPPTYLADLVDATNIAGIEVFRSPAEVPLQYQGMNRECGVVLVWTR